MVAQPVESFLTSGFVDSVAKELGRRGFVTDEHDFAPYRESISEHVEEIERALRSRGNPTGLKPGFTEHPEAGYAYFIYDAGRFADAATARLAVSAWLDDKYKRGNT